MRILYFSQFYTPESIAPSFRAAENSKIWTNSGHEVTVFTGYPNNQSLYDSIILTIFVSSPQIAFES